MTSNRKLRRQAWAQAINEICIGTKKNTKIPLYIKTQNPIYICMLGLTATNYKHISLYTSGVI
jgi:hypothetical protein